MNAPLAAGEAPLFNPVPDWVAGVEGISSEDTKSDGIILLDRQQKVDGNRLISYNDIALRVGSAEQLASFGTVSYNWHPDKGDLTVHSIEIIRGSEVIDVIKNGGKFSILRREQNLEQSWINGILTATMQVEGLKVGDILRTRLSISFADPVLAGNVELTESLLGESVKIGKGAYRLIWPAEKPIKWKITTPNVTPQIRKIGKNIELTIAQPLPKQDEKPASAPARFAPPDLIEASSFANWVDVSKLMAPLYATEGLIAPGSQLAERITKIASTTQDKKMRAAAALRLVQDEIRYLFNGQTQGNYVPQKPSETWEKRYGDCKAKTLLLIVILRALDIEAEAALVNASLGDLVGSRLPSLGAFDHVIARAVIDGKIYWLDGTDIGVRLADLADTPTFRYALPLRAGGSDLETIVYQAPARPIITVDRELDASAGIALPKPYKIKVTIRNALNSQLRQAQSVLDKKQFDQAIDKFVSEYIPNSIITKRSLQFDDEAGISVIMAEGITNLNWNQDGDLRKAKISTVFSDFNLDFDRNRPAWKDIPVSSDAPNFYKITYRLRLPKGGKGFRIENPKSINGRFGSYDISHETRLSGEMFEVDSTWKTSLLEISAVSLPGEREKFARAAAQDVEIVAPADYPEKWRENYEARTAGLSKKLIALYAENIAQDNKQVDAYINRARFFAGIDDRAAAIADLTQALALDPDESTYLWRARLYRLSDPKKALEDIAAARAINPASSQAAAQTAAIYVKQQRFDEALAAIEAALPLQKDRTDLLLEKSEILARSGKGQDAIAVMNKANQDKPGNSALLNGRCWTRALANLELEAALKDCTKAIELTESPSGIYDSRGLVYLRMQRYDDAIADLDAALRISPGISNSLFVRGVARSFTGATAQSKRDIADALLLNPDIEEEYARIGVKPKA